MIIKKFNYLKEGSSEKKAYEMLLLNKDEGHENGIALNYLSEEERITLLEVVTKYEEGLNPFIKKAFRNFKKTGMLPVESM